MQHFLTCSGLSGGEENGRRGYMMTFVIAYIRVRKEKMMEQREEREREREKVNVII